ncbi:MAG: hypothetical protein K2Z80_04835 [Xanthobacteraceae bacterium]|nr:hypothetical protein [Xanthobacteraceae bacterium]
MREDEKTRRVQLFERAMSRDPIARRRYADTDKALVMCHLDQLVANGYAAWAERSNGDLEVRFYSGQRFLLARHTITRIA